MSNTSGLFGASSKYINTVVSQSLPCAVPLLCHHPASGSLFGDKRNQVLPRGLLCWAFPWVWQVGTRQEMRGTEGGREESEVGVTVDWLSSAFSTQFPVSPSSSLSRT